jgi:hypothetical protein
MERPKQQALAFLLGAFLVGGVVGFSGDRVMRRDDSTIEAKRKAMYDDLGLEQGQRVRLDSLFDARNCQLDSVFRPVQPVLDSIKAATRVQINLILTPEQRSRLDVRRRDDEARHAADKKKIQEGCRR